MPKNYLLIYSEQLATEIELLCQNIKASSNTLFQIRKSSSSVYANWSFLSDAFLAERDAHFVRDAGFACDARLRCVVRTHRITHHSAAASLITFLQ